MYTQGMQPLDGLVGDSSRISQNNFAYMASCLWSCLKTSCPLAGPCKLCFYVCVHDVCEVHTSGCELMYSNRYICADIHPPEVPRLHERACAKREKSQICLIHIYNSQLTLVKCHYDVDGSECARIHHLIGNRPHITRSVVYNTYTRYESRRYLVYGLEILEYAIFLCHSQPDTYTCVHCTRKTYK